MPEFKAHVVRFYVPEPKAIQTAALNEDQSLLALARADGSLELWHVAGVLAAAATDGDSVGATAACLVRLPAACSLVVSGGGGGGEGATSVEALCWCGSDGLYSAGLHGHVLRHHATGLHVLATSSVSGGAVWCMAAHSARALLVTGAEDGAVLIHRCEGRDVDDEQSSPLTLLARIAKLEKRVLCVCWSDDGRHLAVGSVNKVCLYSVAEDGVRGHVVCEMGVGRRARRHTLVWSVALLPDLTVVTGDSRGVVSFWQGDVGVLRHSVQTHAADVMALAACPAGDKADAGAICVAGVDPNVVELRRLSSAVNAAAGWTRTRRLALHTRDVRVMLASTHWRISAGVDADIVIDTRGRRNQTVRTCPLPQSGVVAAVPGLPGLAINTGSSLQLWRLPATTTTSPPPARPQLLVELQYRAGDPALCWAVSGDGHWLAYSTRRSWLRVLHVAVLNDRPALTPVRHVVPPPSDASSRRPHVLRLLHFTGSSSTGGHTLLAITCGGQLVRLCMPDMSATRDGGECEIVAELLVEEVCARGSHAHLLVVDEEGGWAAVAAVDGSVTVYDVRQTPVTMVRQVAARKHVGPVTAMVLRHDTDDLSSCSSSQSPLLLLVYVDRSMVELSLTDGNVSEWSGEWSGAGGRLPDAWTRRRVAVSAVVLADQRVLLHDHEAILSLPARHAGAAVRDGRKSRRKTDQQAVAATQTDIDEQHEQQGDSEVVLLDDRFKHLLCVSSVEGVCGSELLIVEAPADSVQQTLPAAFRQKKYGLA